MAVADGRDSRTLAPIRWSSDGSGGLVGRRSGAVVRHFPSPAHRQPVSLSAAWSNLLLSIVNRRQVLSVRDRRLAVRRGA